MLKEVQVNKTEKKVYLLDENYEVFGVLPISTDFYQDTGERKHADDGVYRDTVWYDIDYPDDEDRSAAYGWAYLNIDTSGRAIHGGGANLGWYGSQEPFQELLPTLGCFRMHNVDVFWLVHHWQEAVKNNMDPCIHVVS